MKNILYCFLFISFTLFSQEMILINGEIKSEQNNQAIPYASINLVNTQNSKIVFGSLTDEKGIFKVEIQPGEYKITIDAFEHKNLIITKKIFKNENFGSLMLKLNQEESLKEVVVKTDKPIYRLELDKKVYDVSKDLTAKAGTLADVMQNVPSVNVDADGSLSIRGNTEIRLLIDGKPSSLLGITSAGEALKMIPSENVERIEVITNPSSKYEAAGSGGIINIVMKKGKKTGLSASVEVFTGYYANNGTNLNLNWGKEKWKWNFTAGFRNQKPEGKGEIYQNNFVLPTDQTEKENHIFETFSNRNRVRDQNVYSIGTGFTHNLSEKHAINSSFNFRYSDRFDDNNLTYNDFNFQNLRLRDFERVEKNDNVDKNIDFNAGYLYQIKENHQFSIDAQYNKSIEDAFSLINQNYLYAITSDVNSQDKVFNFQDLNSFMVKSDYTFPFSKKSKFELGARYDFRNIKNDFSVENLTNSGFKIDPNFTDLTDFTEKITAAYTQYSNEKDKFSYQLGLRMESSIIDVISKANNSTITQNYLDFFPSAFLTYNLKDKNKVQLNYSRRVSRPQGRQLLRLFNFSDNRNTFVGNPNLQPAYTDSFELNYSFQIKKFTLNPGIYYQYINSIVGITTFNEGLNSNGEIITISTPVNLNFQERIGVQLIYSYNPLKIWRMFGEFNFYHFNQKGMHNGTDLSGNNYSWNIRYNSNFKLPYGIDFQLNSNYSGPQINNLQNAKGMFILNMGFSKDVFKGKGTLALNVQDVFNSFKRDVTTSAETFTRDLEMQFRLRQINLSFTYRFNQKKKEPSKKERPSDSGMEGGF